MNANFAGIVKRIITEQGEAILADPARLKPFIKTYAQNVPQDERRAFGRCIEAGAYTALKTAGGVNERIRRKTNIARQLQSAGIDPALCTGALDVLEAAVFSAQGGAPQAQKTLQTAPANRWNAWLKRHVRLPCRFAKKYAVPFAAAVLLGAAASVFFILLNTAVPVFEPVVEFNGEEYPSKIIATAATDSMLGGGPRMIEHDGYIGDALGDLGVKLRLNRPDKIVRVEIEGERFIKKSVLETRIPAKKNVEIFPYIQYNWPELENLEEEVSENVTFRLYVDDKLKKETVQTVPFHSIHDEPFWDASRNGNKTLSNYHFVVVIREMERIENALEESRRETERREAEMRETEKREAERREAERREAARREAERAKQAQIKDPYNDKRIRDTLAKVRANLWDVNNDGQTNCVDYSNLFYYYSPFKYSDIVVNYNPKGPQGGFNHQFNVVKINGQLVYIEPQAGALQPYDMKEVWGTRYNPAYNQIQKTTWLYLPRGQAGTEE